VNGVAVFDAVSKGDVNAIESLREYTKEIAVQIFNIQTMFDPEKIAIGGGISAQPIFLEYIREHLKQMYANCIYNVPQAEVVCAKFQNDANLYGAFQCYLAE
jgi:predicted NBD/HSP70 family sugar kinase